MALLDLPQLGAPLFPAELVPACTTVVATGLLHVGYRFASQYTETFDAAAGPGSDNGPELVWDSARAGLMAEAEDPRRKFSLDLGAASAADSTDDVYPRWVEVTVVATQSSQELPEALLLDAVSASDKELALIATDRLPDAIAGNFVKLGSEWVRFASRSGRRLLGVQRGQRGTVARPHQARTGVRVGRTEVLMIKIQHGRDAWNG
jgi:hypothetical protein